MLEKGAIISAMSGSGPTVFGVFEAEEKALSAAKEMGSNWCKVVRGVGASTNGQLSGDFGSPI